MTKKFGMIWLLMAVFMTVNVSAQQQPEVYRLYDNKGKSISY